METQSSTTNELSERLCGRFGKGETTITAFSSLVYYSFDLEMWRQFRERLAAHEMDISDLR